MFHFADQMAAAPFIPVLLVVAPLQVIRPEQADTSF